MRRRTRRSPWLWLQSATGIGALALACNSLTGVNDLEFAEEAEQEVAESPSMSSSPLLPCQVLTGSGCGDGQTCRLSLEQDGPACLDAPSEPLEPYAACSRDAQCPAAHACRGGVCAALCSTAGDCAWANARCIGAGPDTLGFGHCSRDCDLVSPEAPRAGLQACGTGTRCDFTADGGGYTDCVAADGASSEGGPCQESSDCPVGFTCASERCQRVCDRDQNPCPDGATCSGVEVLASQPVGTCCQVPAGDGCDLVTNCGCDAGQTCRWSDDGSTTSCQSLSPSALASGAACASHDECPQGHSCVSGACSQHCNSAADCTIDGSTCAVVSFASGPVEGRSTCSPPCDPLSPAAPSADFQACGAGTTCIYFSNPADGSTFFACGSEGTGQDGAPCASDGECVAGLGCFGSACRRWCAQDENTCGDGQGCAVVLESAGRDLGSCCQIPEGRACDWATDCGCDPGLTCAEDIGVLSCRSVRAEPAPPYSACLVDAECPVAHECVLGACVQHCVSSADCPTPETLCVPLVGEAADGVGVCARNCDAFSPEAPAPGFDACGPGLACSDFVADGLDGGFFMCRPAGPIGEGGDCTAEECAAGLVCFGGTCFSYCELGTSCAAGDCGQTDPPVPAVGGRALGVCPLP